MRLFSSVCPSTIQSAASDHAISLHLNVRAFLLFLSFFFCKGARRSARPPRPRVRLPRIPFSKPAAVFSPRGHGPQGRRKMSQVARNVVLRPARPISPAAVGSDAARLLTTSLFVSALPNQDAPDWSRRPRASRGSPPVSSRGLVASRGPARTAGRWRPHRAGGPPEADSGRPRPAERPRCCLRKANLGYRQVQPATWPPLRPFQHLPIPATRHLNQAAGRMVSCSTTVFAALRDKNRPPRVRRLPAALSLHPSLVRNWSSVRLLFSVSVKAEGRPSRPGADKSLNVAAPTRPERFLGGAPVPKVPTMSCPARDVP